MNDTEETVIKVKTVMGQTVEIITKPTGWVQASLPGRAYGNPRLRKLSPPYKGADWELRIGNYRLGLTQTEAEKTGLLAQAAS